VSEGGKPAEEPGCLRALLALVLGFAALEGGVVLAAVGLHYLLGPAGYTPLAAGLAAGGVLLTLVAPRLLMAIFGARPTITWAQAAASIPDFVLAFWFVLGWAAPQVIGIEAARLLVGIMVLEFVIIHATVGLVAFPQMIAAEAREGSVWRNNTALVFGGMLLVYAMMAAGISAAFKTWWLFLGFAALLGNKFIFDWLSPAQATEERKQQHLARWGTSALFYLLLAFGSIFIPVPRLGAVSGSSGDGIWEVNPEQAVMMGALYFALLAFFELCGGFRRANVVQPKEA
jgi:hypothetical protein